jgi:hypothetical protein
MFLAFVFNRVVYWMNRNRVYLESESDEGWQSELDDTAGTAEKRFGCSGGGGTGSAGDGGAEQGWRS